MPTREEIQSLGQQIALAYDDRVKGIAELRAEAEAVLTGFDSAHQAMAESLRAELAKGEQERLAEARALRGELAGGAADRRKAVGAALRELQNEQAGGRDEWQKLVTTMQARRGAQ